MEYELRPITTDDIAEFRQAVAIGFGSDPKPEGDQRLLEIMPIERNVAVFDDGKIVGTLGDFDFQMTVPGGNTVGMAGTTMVTVMATHRRKGILRAMMRWHLDNAVRRNEPVAALWASEPEIYGRFGFGLATEFHEVSVNRLRVSLPEPAADLVVRNVAKSDMQVTFAPIWDAAALSRSGFVDRRPRRWQDFVDDPEHAREGGSALRSIVVRRGDQAVGYAMYRQVPKWDDGIPSGQIKIEELVPLDHDAYVALWHFLTSIDLFTVVEHWNAALDDSLAMLANHSRSVKRVMMDALYVRILDVPTALTARTYEADGEIIVRVHDDMGYANGTYRLVVTNGTATVTPTDAEPDAELNVAALGALYLGRRCADLLVRSGVIAALPHVAVQLDQLFGTAQPPWCPEMF